MSKGELMIKKGIKQLIAEAEKRSKGISVEAATGPKPQKKKT